MPPMEIRPAGFQPPHGQGAIADRQGAGPVAHDKAKPASSPVIVRVAVLEPGQPPVDTDRVAVIRRAIEQGHYPIIPARVADAIIAAGLLLRTRK